MHLSKPMQYYRRLFGWHETRTSMGAYGADTLKPTALSSNKAWTRKLKKKASREDIARFERLASKKGNVKTFIDSSDGTKRFSGVADNLKGSQEYPTGCAKAVVEHVLEQPMVVESDSSDSDYFTVPGPNHETDHIFEDLGADGMSGMMSMRANVMPLAL